MRLKSFLLATLICISGLSYAQDSPSLGGSPIVPIDTVTKATPVDNLSATDSVIVKTTDSAVTKIPVSTITAPANTTLFGFKVPTWVTMILTILGSILASLPTLQLLLKRIPGATPIAGFIGKILDFFTAFQKNIPGVIPPPSTP